MLGLQEWGLQVYATAEINKAVGVSGSVERVVFTAKQEEIFINPFVCFSLRISSLKIM